MAKKFTLRDDDWVEPEVVDHLLGSLDDAYQYVCSLDGLAQKLINESAEVKAYLESIKPDLDRVQRYAKKAGKADAGDLEIILEALGPMRNISLRELGDEIAGACGEIDGLTVEKESLEETIKAYRE